MVSSASWERGGEVLALDGNLSETFFGNNILRIDLSGVLEALLGKGDVTFSLCGAGEPYLDIKIFGIVLGGFLKSVDSIPRFVVVQQENTVEDGYVRIAAIRLHELIYGGSCLGQFLLCDEDARVDDLQGGALGVLRDQIGVYGFGALDLMCAGVEVLEEFRALGGIAQVIGGLTKDSLGLGRVILPEIELSKRGAGCDILGIGGDGSFEFHLGAGLVSLSGKQASQYRVRGNAGGSSAMALRSCASASGLVLTSEV